MPVMHSNDWRESEFPMLRTILHNLFPRIPSYFAQGFQVPIGRGNGGMTPRRRRQAHPAIEAVEARRMLSGITIETTIDSNNLNNLWTDGLFIDPSAMPLTPPMPLMPTNDCILGTPTPILPAAGQPSNGAGNTDTSPPATTSPNVTYVTAPPTIGGDFNNSSAPVILIPPVGLCMKVGSTVTFSADATLSTGVRWIESHDQGITWTVLDDLEVEISFYLSAMDGASSTDLEMTATLAMSNTMYAAVFSNNFGSTFTPTALLKVFA
jgi:hypothetical protein